MIELRRARGSRGPGLALAAAIVCMTAFVSSGREAAAAPGRAALFFPGPWDMLDPSTLRLPIDATALCLPAGIDRGLGRGLRKAIGDPPNPEAVAEWLALNRSLEGSALGHFAEARAALDDRARQRAWAGLEESRTSSDRSERVCAELESARLMLGLDRFPEAAAHARRAQHAGAAGPRHRDAIFYRAEALVLARRTAESKALYLSLLDAEREPLRLAARLRLAEDSFRNGRIAEARKTFEAVLPRAREFGAPLASFGPKVVQAAVQAGDWDSLREWLAALSRTRMAPDAADWIRLTVADLAASDGHLAVARVQYAELAEARRGTRIGKLAELRWLGLGGETSAADREARLRAATFSAQPSLALYARILLGQVLIAREDRDAALEVLARAAFERPGSVLEPEVRALLGATLSSMGEGARDAAGCAHMIGQVGWRRLHLLSHSDVVQPFLDLGACYERFGLQDSAKQLYRAMVRHFGADTTVQVALPLAQVSLATGEVARARTVAMAKHELEGPDRDRWALLLARIHRLEQQPAAALVLLLDLVERRKPEGAELASLRLLSDVAREIGVLAEHTAVMTGALLVLASPDEASDASAAGHLALELARREEAAGRRGMAESLYRKALAWLPDGPSRAEASYWLSGVDGSPPGGAGLRSVADSTTAGVWAELASHRLRVDGLRSRLRRGLPNPLDTEG